jgi:penicillin-binding protein 1C
LAVGYWRLVVGCWLLAIGIFTLDFRLLTFDNNIHGFFNSIFVLLKRHYWVLSGFGIVFVLWYVSLPVHLFDDPACTVIEDRNGHLLGARIADDGQWRFPLIEAVPVRFKESVIQFEDRYFYSHPGFNPVSTYHALVHNVKAGRIQRGGSTISMQVIRLARKGKPRTIFEKILEIVMATRLECRYSKDEILAIYASHAPFGGNVVGLEAASWRYYGRSSEDLSWAESATLAVLPNAPSLVFPGRNQEALLNKRNRLLDRLLDAGKIDSLTCILSKQEPLPGRPRSLPQLAPHLLDRVSEVYKAQVIQTTVDAHIQQRASKIIETHSNLLKANQVFNAAALIIEVKTGHVMAYIGNSSQGNGSVHGAQVDVVVAPRSTGSILKPFLFLAMMEEGSILPATLIPDIPTQIAGYSPKNFQPGYDGAVPADQVLSRSLNVPSVRMLRDFGLDKFHHTLRELGMTTIQKQPSHYGLSLILGGAEGSLWELTGIYASLSRVLSNYYDHGGRYDPQDLHMPSYLSGKKETDKRQLVDDPILSAAAIWLCWEALVSVNRPDAESGWRTFSSQGRIAWKTGTSFGGRDAWAIGSNRDYVVGVWAGNATGEGRPGLTGTGSAAPIMFDLFGLLPGSAWFDQPFDEMVQIGVCRDSGHRAGRYCSATDIIWAHARGLQSASCPYHQLIHLDSTSTYRVNSQCEEVSAIKQVSWFILPPAMEWFYKYRNPLYKTLPPFRPDCDSAHDIPTMELVYPGEAQALYIPRELDGSPGSAIFEVAHRHDQRRIFWHLDDEYIGTTQMVHRMALNPSYGFHTLTLVDEDGHRLSRVFEVVSNEMRR